MGLANQLGFVHVDEMLSLMSPQEFEERIAYRRLTGEGELRIMLSAILARLEYETARYLAAKSGKPMQRKYDPESFTPKLYRWRKRRRGMLKGNDPAVEQMFASTVKHGTHQS